MRVLLVLLSIFAVLIIPHVTACTPYKIGSTAPDICEFYKCLEDKYKCNSQAWSKNNYPMGYGYKYCTKFKALTGAQLTPKGLAWRDSTLECLQAALVRFDTPTPSTTCKILTQTAFDSHPLCYTKTPESICLLTATEWLTIAGVVESKDLVTARSAKQMAITGGICTKQIASVGYTSATSALDSLKKKIFGP